MSCNACLGKFTKCILIPHRYLVAILTMLAITTAYTTRNTITIAITEMVVKKNKTEKHTDSCPVQEEHHSYVSVKDPDILYKWSESIQGVILSSFFWGYLLSHIPGGILAEKIGGKQVLGIAMLLNNVVVTISPPIIVWFDGSYIVVVLTRFVMGLGQGVVYPVVTAMMAQWAPPHERSFLASIAYSGQLLGSVLGCALGGFLIYQVHNWNIIFLFFGALGLIWNVGWQLFCYSYPATNPCLKEKEKLYLEEHLGAQVSKEKLKIPWSKIVTSVPVWAMTSAQFGHDWCFFAVATDMPKYMNGVLKFNVKENGLWLSLIYVLMYITTIFSGQLADCLIVRNWLSIKRTRQIFAIIGNLLPAVFLLVGSYAGCNRMIAVLMFVLSMASMGFYYSGVKVNALDLAPNFAGTLMGLVNGLGVLAGIIIPLVIGALTPNQSLFEWRLVFWINFGVCVVTTALFVIFLSGDVQKWNYAKSEQPELT